MADLARGFPDDGRLPPPEAAQATYKAMSPEDRALVDMHAARLKTKGDPRYRTRALAIVQGLNADVGSDDSPEVPDTEPTTGEAIGAGIMGAGRAGLDIIGAQRVSKAKPEDDSSLAGRTEASMNEAAATAPGAFGTGHGVMDAISALTAGGTAAKRIAQGGLTTSGPRAALHRLLGAGRELVTESVEGGGTPTARGAVARGVRALLGAGGEVKPSQIIDETSVAPRPQPPPIPSVATPLAEIGPRPAPPLAKAPLPADIPAAPPDLPPEPLPDPRERALADLVDPADMPADGPAMTSPEIAAEGAKLIPSLANDVVEGDLPLRAAAAMSRGAARSAAAPKGVSAVKEALLSLFKSDPSLAKNASANAGKLAKRLGADPHETKMAITAIAWGR